MNTDKLGFIKDKDKVFVKYGPKDLGIFIYDAHSQRWVFEDWQVGK